MTVELAKWWFKRKFGCISLALSFAQIVIIWSPLALFQISGRHPTFLIVNLSSTTWLIGGLGSFGFAVAGLTADSQRMTALVALVGAIVTFVICGLPMLV
jgi:hypothetical protein